MNLKMLRGLWTNQGKVEEVGFEKDENVKYWINPEQVEKMDPRTVDAIGSEWMNPGKLGKMDPKKIESKKVQRVGQWMNLWKLERTKNEEVQQWIMILDLAGRTRVRKIEIGKYLHHCLKWGEIK